MPSLIGLVTFAFFVVTLVDVILRDSASVKHLPKMGWILVVVLLPFIGGVLWWAVGREYAPRPVRSAMFPDHMRAPVSPVDTRTTEQQLADLEREEREAELRAEIARRRRERGGGASRE